jgi:hypothetical protein
MNEDAMKPSENGFFLNRREAMFLSAVAGVEFALSDEAHGSDSTKTGVHQEPRGFCVHSRQT